MQLKWGFCDDRPDGRGVGLSWLIFWFPPFGSPGCLLFPVGLFVPGGRRAPRASRHHGMVLLWALLAAGAGAFGCWCCWCRCFCRPNFSARSIWGQFRSKSTHKGCCLNSFSAAAQSMLRMHSPSFTTIGPG